MADDGRKTPDQFAFGERLLNLLDQGRFTATYKYAVLLALIDVCLENAASDGSAPTFVTTRQLAEKVLELYWPQTTPFVTGSNPKLLTQSSSGGQAEILSTIAKFRGRHGVRSLRTVVAGAETPRGEI
jgi:hypothetical protein